MSVLKQMDWFEEIESVNVDNKVIDVGDELDDVHKIGRAHV